MGSGCRFAEAIDKVTHPEGKMILSQVEKILLKDLVFLLCHF